MRQLAYLIFGISLGTMLVLAGCAEKSCPPFEKVNTGSGCRDTSNGEYTAIENCSC